MNENINKMRTVMLACPSHDGKIDVWHASALSETCKIGITKNINVIAIYMSYDSLVQRARNDIFKLAIETEVDDLFFIDSDKDWNPFDFFKMLDHDVPIVAAPVPNKSDIENYNVKLIGDFIVEDNGLVSVDGVGTEMMRIRKDALITMWKASEEYIDQSKNVTSRSVFEVKVVDGKLWPEDILFCKKWKDMGEKIYIDPTVNCSHIGTKRWIGNFYQWIKLYNKR